MKKYSMIPLLFLSRFEFVLSTCDLDRREFESRPPLGVSVKIECPRRRKEPVEGGGDLIG